jgi:hypothetical protein
VRAQMIRDAKVCEQPVSLPYRPSISSFFADLNVFEYKVSILDYMEMEATSTNSFFIK